MEAAQAIEEAQRQIPEPEVAVAPPEAVAPEVLSTEGELPQVEAPAMAAPELPQTVSEEAFEGDMTPAEREQLATLTSGRMAAAIDPFLLACSNLRVDLRAAAAGNPGLIALLGKIAFGDLLPGITHASRDLDPGLPPAASKLAQGAALQPIQMMKVVDSVGKQPMIDFNLNYPELTTSESDDEFLDDLSTHLETGNEALRAGIAGRPTDELAALCVAFDTRTNSTMHFENEISKAIAKMLPIASPLPDDDDTESPRELAFVGDPDDGDNQLAVVERDTQSASAHEEVIEIVPDELKELALDKYGKPAG